MNILCYKKRPISLPKYISTCKTLLKAFSQIACESALPSCEKQKCLNIGDETHHHTLISCFPSVRLSRGYIKGQSLAERHIQHKAFVSVVEVRLEFSKVSYRSEDRRKCIDLAES